MILIVIDFCIVFILLYGKQFDSTFIVVEEFVIMDLATGGSIA